MLLGNVMTVFLGITSFLVVIPALWLLCRGLWPERVARAAARCDRNLYKPLLTGVPVTMATLILAGIFRKLPGGGPLIAGAMLCAYIVFASAGISGLAAIIGGRLSRQPEVAPMQATLRGSAILALTFLIPVLGWFLILPASMLIGSGAMALTFLDGNQKTAGSSLAPAPPRPAARELVNEYRGFAAGR
ncbi:MAG: hypothetical protein ACREDR_03160 [Blastocatellia bacterium]